MLVAKVARRLSLPILIPVTLADYSSKLKSQLYIPAALGDNIG